MPLVIMPIFIEGTLIVPLMLLLTAGAVGVSGVGKDTVAVPELTGCEAVMRSYRIASATALNPPGPSCGVVVVRPDIAPPLYVPTHTGSAESLKPVNCPVIGLKCLNLIS